MNKNRRTKPLKIDGRTRESRQIKAITGKLTSDPNDAAKALLRGIISRNAVIEREIYNRALTEGNLFVDGQLNPIVDKTLLKYQNASKSALVELMKLEGAKPSDNSPEDIFSDVFDD